MNTKNTQQIEKVSAPPVKKRALGTGIAIVELQPGFITIVGCHTGFESKVEDQTKAHFRNRHGA